MPKIQMVDLQGQYRKIKSEIDKSIKEVLKSAAFINGPKVKEFETNLGNYLDTKHVIPCGNGTDALQIAMMGLGLKPGDEVIVPAFTYVATVEVAVLLGLNPVMVDVDKDTFNLTAEIVEQAINVHTRAIVPVHLFGQSTDMEPLMKITEKYNLQIIEDNAQSIGAEYKFSDAAVQKTGNMGNIGCISFYPSKNLGAYGDGGAMTTNNDELADKVRRIASHGQSERYKHKYIGVNSRLDAIQAAILDVKLKYLDEYIAARQIVAAYYDKAFENIKLLQTPKRVEKSTHVFHQYTLIVKEGHRDALKKFLYEHGIPSMIYYPLSVNEQEAFKGRGRKVGDLPVTKSLCESVLSLPIHTEMTTDQLEYIVESIQAYFTNA